MDRSDESLTIKEPVKRHSRFDSIFDSNANDRFADSI